MKTLFAFLMFTSAAAFAQSPQVNPVVFTRSTVTIVSDALPVNEKDEADRTEAEKDKKEDADEKKNNETSARPPEKIKHYFKVEVRGPSALKMEWFFSLDALKDKEGMMIMYDYPQQFLLEPNKIYKPLDILFIDEEGTIKAIAPNVILSNISKAMQPDSPMKAMLFLKGGTTSESGIMPGDNVIHAAFIAAPVILH